MPRITNSLPGQESKPEFVRNGFNEISRHYDCLNDLMTAGMHRSWKNEAAAMLRLQPGMNVLDLCAGTGDLAQRASKLTTNDGLTIALDFAPQMMQEGQNRSGGGSYNIINWICADAGLLPFTDNSFDGALVGFGLRNVVSIETVLHEVNRVLRPGARFVSLDTAETEWKILMPFYRFYMNYIVPMMGRLVGSKDMYAYLTSSAEAFDSPELLCQKMQRCGFTETGFTYRPRILGGAALTWGQKPVKPSRQD